MADLIFTIIVFVGFVVGLLLTLLVLQKIVGFITKRKTKDVVQVDNESISPPQTNPQPILSKILDKHPIKEIDPLDNIKETMSVLDRSLDSTTQECREVLSKIDSLQQDIKQKAEIYFTLNEDLENKRKILSKNLETLNLVNMGDT